jgi:hypothetical protein
MHIGGIGKGKKPNTLLYRSEYSNLKVAETSMGWGLGSSEEDWWR